jgi:alpha-D-ribose 1-methylphosphonate 5-triphosphate synthase subunit PhnH
MNLDRVHDLQAVYRKSLHAISRPGELVSLEEQALKMDEDVHCYPSSALMALLLLDIDVTFSVVSENPQHFVQWIHEMTYAKVTTTEQADYIFILFDATNEAAEEAWTIAKTGDLIHPHHGATILMEVTHISTDAVYLLQGPGIRTTASVDISTSIEWTRLRELKNIEYPMGIDLFIMDAQHQLLGLPRTTQLKRQVKM